MEWSTEVRGQPGPWAPEESPSYNQETLFVLICHPLCLCLVLFALSLLHKVFETDSLLEETQRVETTSFSLSLHYNPEEWFQLSLC